jgi:hypothetical protein
MGSGKMAASYEWLPLPQIRATQALRRSALCGLSSLVSKSFQSHKANAAAVYL